MTPDTMDCAHEIAFGAKNGLLAEGADGFARVWNDQGEFLVSTASGRRIAVCGNSVKQLEQFIRGQQRRNS